MDRLLKRLYLHTSRTLTGPLLLPPLIGAWLAQHRLPNAAVAARLKAAAASHGGELKLTVVGDTHYSFDGAADLHQTIHTLAPDGVLHLGDYADEGGLYEVLRHLANWDGMHQDRHAGLIHVIGNHDKRTFGRFWFKRLFGAPRGAYDLGAWRLILLDNTEHPGFYTQDAAWLATLPPKPSVLAFHKPPKTPKWPRHAAEIPAGVDLFGTAAQIGVQLALCGHCHVYDEQEIAGVRTILTGGGAPVGADLGFGTVGRHVLQLTLPADPSQGPAVRKVELGRAAVDGAKPT